MARLDTIGRLLDREILADADTTIAHLMGLDDGRSASLAVLGFCMGGATHTFSPAPGPGHAFLNFSNPERYRPVQAADAWARMLAFLERHLVRSA
jgi:dienelactone hydrolase